MAESPKKTERVASYYSERELLDLSLLANADNRTVSEMIRVIVRRYMYGRVGATVRSSQPVMSASSARGDFADTAFLDGN